MDNKNLTPKESMALISAMIQQSKHRVTMSDLRISTMWSVISIVTAIAVTVLLVTMGDPIYNYGWFAIPAMGIPLNILMLRGKEKKGTKTYVDSICDTIWKTVGYIGLAISAICIVFNICGHHQAWLVMFYYAFIVVGFGTVAMGAAIKEKSYLCGGIISILAGFGIIAAQLSGFQLLMSWAIPVYITCFLFMFIVPAMIIRHKIKQTA